MRLIGLAFLFSALLLPGIPIEEDPVTERARKYIEDLCAPEMHGRGYAFRGDKLAAEYIRELFERTGLENLSRNYYQSFSISINTFPGVVRCMIDDTELVPGREFIVDKGSPSFKGTKNVFHITRKDLLDNEWQSAIDVDQFLLINNNPAEDETSDEAEIVSQVISLLRKGSPYTRAGVVLYSRKKLTLKGFRERAAYPVVIIQTQGDLSQTSRISLEIDSRYCENYNTRNVIGFLEGKKYPDSVIIYTAHYDHIGRMGETVYFPGANDNASGVAMIVNLAEHYASQDNEPDYSMMFIAFSAEEIGLFGSRYYVANPLLPHFQTKFLINIDLAGNGEEGITVVNGKQYRSHFELMKRINQQEGYLPRVKPRGESCNSDHCKFHEAGVPSIFIYTMGGSAAYHDIYDTPESLPLNMYRNYYDLLVEFTDSLQIMN